jgi:hypothetical protein
MGQEQLDQGLQELALASGPGFVIANTNMLFKRLKG